MQKNVQIKIFDTTLRDGQQCPGAGLSFENNLRYARLASQLKIDVMEAGFPSASNTDFEIVYAIAGEIAPHPDAPIVAGLAQLRMEQIERTVEALAPAIPYGKARVHTYVPVDAELLEASLGERAGDRRQIVRNVFDCVSYAVAAGCEVQFSPEGYSRVGNNFDFATELILAAVDAGATVINCPDTIGGACEAEGENYFVNNMKRHAEIVRSKYPDREIAWSVHCHNDLGLAVANTINAVFRGPATQIEGCINGIGERAGNASLEQCIMLIKQFGKQAGTQSGTIYITRTDASMLKQVSDFVGKNMLPRQPHWPVTGDNAARHSSGGHTNAILRNPMAYQPFDPAAIGQEITFVFGPLSGGNHAQSIIHSRGYVCEEGEKAEIAQYIKDYYSERRKGITDNELMEAYFDYREPCKIAHIDYSKHHDRATVHFSGEFKKKPISIDEQHEGKDSALAALKKALERYFGDFEIMSHRSRSETSGTDALSRSFISIAMKNPPTAERVRGAAAPWHWQAGAGDPWGAQGDGWELYPPENCGPNEHFEGTAVDQDIEISAMKALVDALNRAYVAEHFAQADLPASVSSGGATASA